VKNLREGFDELTRQIKMMHQQDMATNVLRNANTIVKEDDNQVSIINRDLWEKLSRGDYKEKTQGEPLEIQHLNVEIKQANDHNHELSEKLLK
jgi:hypothetical protein